MDKQELKNCPFCGEHANLAIDGDNRTYGGCSDPKQECIGSDILPWLSDEEEAEARGVWNTRPEEDRLNARIKELEEELKLVEEESQSRGRYLDSSGTWNDYIAYKYKQGE